MVDTALMKSLVAVALVAVRLTASAGGDLEGAEVWASAKDGKTPFVLTPLVGETDWTEGKAGYLQTGAYETWNETAFTLTAKGDGRFFVGLSAPHNVRRLYPEVAWTDISIAGAGRQENLDFAHGLTSWGVNTKDAPRIETVAGRRALVVRADRGRYRGLDLKAGDTVTVRAKFRLMGPSAAPAENIVAQTAIARRRWSRSVKIERRSDSVEGMSIAPNTPHAAVCPGATTVPAACISTANSSIHIALSP